MKTLYKCFLTVFIFCITNHSFAQTNIFPSTGAAGIGTTTPDASSLLEIKSTSKGILIPRMSKNQRDAIATPATGLLIYQTNSLPGFYYYNGSVWTAVSAKGANTALSNLAAPTAVNVDLLAGTDNTINLGSANNSWKDVYLDGSVYLGGARFLAYTTGTGSGNTALGSNALYANSSGFNNTATGNAALYHNIGGENNTANGFQALEGNQGGHYNTAMGSYALHSSSNTSDNTAVGAFALINNIGSDNTAVGSDIMVAANSSGSSNVAVGEQALYDNTSGYSNVAIGKSALVYNTIQNNIVAVGDSALYHNGGPGSLDGIANVAVGSKALFSNTTGRANSAFGHQSAYSNTTGIHNTSEGYKSLYSNTTGTENTAIGYQSLNSNKIGDNNTANGSNALYSNTTGDGNAANGDGALYSNTTGNYNTANGLDALYSNTKGYGNTANGEYALSSNTTGSYNTAIGNLADVSSGNHSNSTALGNNALTTASNQVRIGDSYVTSIGGYKGWTIISDGRVNKNFKANVPGLAFINLLKPITYNLDLDAADKIIQRPAIKDKDGKTIQPTQEQITTRQIQQQVICTGFIAQDVEASAKKIGYDFDGVDASKNDKDLYGLRYSEFVVPLVKAVQELSVINDNKDAKIDSLQQQNKDQQKINAGLQKQMNDLRNLILQIQQTQQQCSPCSGSTTVNAMQQNNITLINTASLEQNIPNPFTNTTTIGYYLPTKVSSAQIIISDKNGKQLKQLNLSGAGKGTIHVDASTLASGAYNYSLYVNGKFIASKQMVLAK